MKQLFLSIALLMCVAGVSAEEVQKYPAKKPSIAGFVSNGFWDNWEVSIGGGMTYSAMSGWFGGDDVGKAGDHLNYELNVSATKWFHPVFGARLQLMGGQLVNDTNAKMAPSGQWPFLFIHTDAMINFSNWVGGYRADRAYYAVPFAGFGYQALNFTSSAHNRNLGTNQEFAFTLGLLNKFRVCKAIDINLELKGWLFRAHGVPEEYVSGTYAQAYSATVGLTYRFNEREWQRGVKGFTEKDVKAFQEAVAAGDAALAAAQAANAKLAKDLKEAQGAAAQATIVADKAKADLAIAKANNSVYLSGSSITFFPCGKSRLTELDKIRLDLIAEQIKNSPKDKVYTVEGHADAATGTDAINNPLSEKRAKNVYDYLISQGVNPDQLSYKGFGSKNNPYKGKSNSANRVAIIK